MAKGGEHVGDIPGAEAAIPFVNDFAVAGG
jgi:hypothetical protein